MIDSSEISVIIQGAFNTAITPNAVLSVKKFLPKAEIILSVWEGDKLPEDLQADKILLNKDPGFCYYSDEETSKKNNVNRQIVSTLAGLKNATRKYTLKMRTDFVLISNNFLNYFDKYKKVNPQWQLFEKKLVACSFFARIPEISKTALHISDVLFFGLTKDIFNLFDIPLMPKEYETCFMHQGHKYTKYCPEQYIFCSYLTKNKMAFRMDNQYDLTDENIKQTHNYFANNFVFLSFGQYGVLPAPSLIDARTTYLDCYTLFKWENLYKKYVDSAFVIEEKKDKVHNNLLKIRRCRSLAQLLSCFIITSSKRKKYRRDMANKLLAKFIHMDENFM